MFAVGYDSKKLPASPLGVLFRKHGRVIPAAAARR